MDLAINQTHGMVCAHHHLYSSLARGMPGPADPPLSFLNVLESVWWKLDQALRLGLGLRLTDARGPGLLV